MSKSKDKSIDWRTLPRKPAHLRKDRRIVLNVTVSQHKAYKLAAGEVDETMADFIINAADERLKEIGLSPKPVKPVKKTRRKK